MATVTPADEETERDLPSLSGCAPNSSLPLVYRVPPEILAKIFIFRARDDWDEDVYRSEFCVPRWVNISYVCRRWRAIALGFPALWAYHFTVSPPWTEELLVRSKQAPLKISICSSSWMDRPWLSKLVRKLLDHKERIQVLYLCAQDTALPSKLSELCAPRLQILKIRGCALPCDSLSLGGLTTLSLIRIPVPRRLNIVVLLIILNCAHGLTFLHLENALASARDVPKQLYLEVGLPCLARLSVVAPISAVVKLLSWIDIPSKTEVRLGVKSEYGSSIGEYAQITSPLTRRFARSNDPSSFCPTIRSLSIFSSLDSYASLYMSEHGACIPPGPIAGIQWDAGFPLIIKLEMEESMEISDGLQIIGDLCCSIPLMDVETLKIIPPPSAPEFWEKMLGHLHGLRRMILSHDNLSHGLLPLLAANPPTGTPTTSDDFKPASGHMFLPALEELELHCMVPTSETLWDGPFERRLFGILSTRQALCPRLTLIRCDGCKGDESEGEDEDDESDWEYEESDEEYEESDEESNEEWDEEYVEFDGGYVEVVEGPSAVEDIADEDDGSDEDD